MKVKVYILFKNKQGKIDRNIPEISYQEIDATQLEEIVRFLMRMVNNLPQDKKYVYVTEFEWIGRTHYSYSIRDFFEFVSGIETMFKLGV